MRNLRLVCFYALMMVSVSVLSFATSDWSRGAFGVSLDLPVVSTASADDPVNPADIFDHLTNGFGEPHKVPEPSTTVLFGLGMAGAYLVRRRSRR